jgi:hypothetical protein
MQISSLYSEQPAKLANRHKQNNLFMVFLSF